jgi:hypothetical protein
MFTHYTLDDTSELAYCGRRMRDADRHSPFPTCGGCAARLSAELALEEAIDQTPLPLDADEAATALDPVLNAGVPVAAQPDFADYLFDLVTSINRTYAQSLAKGGRS